MTSPTCPKCGEPLSDGWCPECARVRTKKWFLAILVASPILAFGSCAIGLPATYRNDYSDPFLILGQWLCFGGLLVGILVVIAYRVKLRMH